MNIINENIPLENIFLDKIKVVIRIYEININNCAIKMLFALKYIYISLYNILTVRSKIADHYESFNKLGYVNSCEIISHFITDDVL